MTSEQLYKRAAAWFVLAVALAALAIGLGISAAQAQTEPQQDRVLVSVPIGNVVRGEVGDLKPARDPVPVSELGIAVGQECLVGLVGQNGESEWPNNDLILGTGGDTLVAPDFEEFTGKVTSVEKIMIMGRFVTFDVLLGSRVSSGGLIATFDCPPPEVPPSTTTTVPTTVPPTTTTSIPTPTTTSSTTLPSTTTTVSPTTTTEPPAPTSSTVPPDTTTTTETPVGSVPAGGGACADDGCRGTDPYALIIAGGVALLALSALTLYRART